MVFRRLCAPKVISSLSGQKWRFGPRGLQNVAEARGRKAGATGQGKELELIYIYIYRERERERETDDKYVHFRIYSLVCLTSSDTVVFPVNAISEFLVDVGTSTNIW